MLPFFIICFWFWGALSLPCCVQASSSCREQGPLSSCGVRSFSAQWLLAAGHQLEERGLQQSQHAASAGAAHRLSCSSARGLCLDQGLNLCPLHWQVGSYPLYHQRSPILVFIYLNCMFLNCFFYQYGINVLPNNSLIFKKICIKYLSYSKY